MKLKIAIQKSGRLYEDSIKILREAGIELSSGMNPSTSLRAGKLRAEAYNFPLEVLFLRDDDIPQYVEDGVADAGIVGENIIYETNKKLKVVEKLGFGKCRLSIAVPKNAEYKSIKELRGKKIATSYPVILSKYLKKKRVEAKIETVSGSVEIAPSVGLADAICDLVSSGSTLFANGLKETEVIFKRVKDEQNYTYGIDWEPNQIKYPNRINELNLKYFACERIPDFPSYIIKYFENGKMNYKAEFEDYTKIFEKKY